MHHSANEMLADIGAKKFAWYDQPPGIRDRPFCEAASNRTLRLWMTGRDGAQIPVLGVGRRARGS